MNPFAKAPTAVLDPTSVTTADIDTKLYGIQILDHDYQSSSGMMKRNIKKYVKFENGIPSVLNIIPANGIVKDYYFEGLDYIESGSYFTGFYKTVEEARQVIVDAPSNVYTFTPAVAEGLIFLSFVKNENAKASELVEKKADALKFLTELENAD